MIPVTMSDSFPPEGVLFPYYTLPAAVIQEKLLSTWQKLWYSTIGDRMERSNIEKIAQSAEDRLLLAKLWDKMNAGMRKNIPAARTAVTRSIASSQRSILTAIFLLTAR